VRSNLVGLALAALVLSSSARSSAPADPLEVPRVVTGATPSWFRDRMALALEVLKPNVPSNVLDDVALSIVAQWAHETARGQSEFCFNLGGWRARPRDHFFVGDDRGVSFHWTAYRDLPNAVADQLERLHDRFPTAWKLLVAQPTSSAWIEELGHSGYYQQKPADYARAWAMHRAELGRLVS
jgi:hypothetical protein